MSPAIPSRSLDPSVPVHGGDFVHLDPEMMELSLLLPRWQAFALESAAKQRGISTGHMLRRMIAAVVGTQPPIANQ